MVKVKITNRFDGKQQVAERFRDVKITVGSKSLQKRGQMSKNPQCAIFMGPSSKGAIEEINCLKPLKGKFLIVQFQMIGEKRQLHINEIEVYSVC